MINNLCSPALLYVGFSLMHIIIDMYKELYNTAFFKFLIMILFSIILNILCQRGLGTISWIIVFIPFIFMTIITTLLLFVFGMDPKTGQIQGSSDASNITTNLRPNRDSSSENSTQLQEPPLGDIIGQNPEDNVQQPLIPSLPQPMPPPSVDTLPKNWHLEIIN